jgi:hypothetical protein
MEWRTARRAVVLAAAVGGFVGYAVSHRAPRRKQLPDAPSDKPEDKEPPRPQRDIANLFS